MGLSRAIAALVISLSLVVALAGAQTPGSKVVPFRIHVPDSVLGDLKDRLARTRFPDQIAGSGWEYGTDLAYLKELVAYWRTTFNWREQERRLNAFTQFTTNIDGIDVHFIHQRSPNPNAFPIVMTHGWPGSFFEFAKVIGPLTDPIKYGGKAEDSFDVVALSLPGYGFSGKPTEPGFNTTRMAGVIAKLMARLGYTRYGAQGGDWGALISRILAIDDAQHVAGLHLNMCNAGAPAGVVNPTEGVPAAELERWQSRTAYMTSERGYSQIQGTRPQTVGYGLNDSPAGLAAWIVEKLRSWSDSDGNVEKSFTRDEILTNIMIYWVTQTATSSARLYFENNLTGNLSGSVQRANPPDTRRVEVPTACAAFPKEVVLPPRKFVEARYNLKRWTEMPRGGHFAALEQPQLLVDDVRAFFREVRKAP